MPILKIGPIPQRMACDRGRRIHRGCIARKFPAALIGMQGLLECNPPQLGLSSIPGYAHLKRFHVTFPPQ